MSSYAAPDGEPEKAPKNPGGPRKNKGWHAAARKFTVYNPLDLPNLGRNVEAEMLVREPEPLGDVAPMYGSGIYALYYDGPHELYAPISSPDCQHPIYVGQARPQGTRKGTVDESTDSVALWDRIVKDHKSSIEQVFDLEVEHFRVRYLVAKDVFVTLAESMMIGRYRPVWNSIVEGFGNHDPGKDRRKTGKRPPWDELHPGRWWSHHLNMSTPSLVSAELSRQRIQDFFAGVLSEADIELIEAEEVT